MILPGTAIETVYSRPPVGWNLAHGLNVFTPPSSPPSSILRFCVAVSMPQEICEYVRPIHQQRSEACARVYGTIRNCALSYSQDQMVSQFCVGLPNIPLLGDLLSNSSWRLERDCFKKLLSLAI